MNASTTTHFNLPVLRRMRVDGYQLYPNKDGNPGIDRSFSSGVTVVVGINGLGKTTLLRMILHGLLGRYVLPPTRLEGLGGSADYELKQSIKPKYFASRVPDDARDATVMVEFQIAHDRVQVERSLHDLKLMDFRVNEEDLEETDEQSALRRLTELVGVQSEYELAVLLQSTMFFLEDRTELFWLRRAQFELLRILFIPKALSGKLQQRNRDALKLDSEYRNARNVLRNRLKKTLNIDSGQKEEVKAAIEKLNHLRTQNQAYLDKQQDLVADRDSNNRTLKELRDQLLRTDIAISEQERKVEQFHEEYLETLLPELDDLSRLTVAHVLSDTGCVICGSRTDKFKEAVKELLDQGNCPVCLSEPKDQERAPQYGDSDQLDKEFASLQSLRREKGDLEKSIQATRRHLREIDLALIELENDQQLTQDEIRAIRELPGERKQQIALVEWADDQEDQLRSQKEQAERAADLYLEAVEEGQAQIQSIASRVSRSFSKYAQAFISEDVDLELNNEIVDVGQSGARVEIPVFTVRMTSGTSSVPTKRIAEDAVSESQKEFLDLAFRMALLDAIDAKGASIFIETPEASLDAVFIKNAGDMLRSFSGEGESRSNRQVVATCNLVGNEMIPALLGLLDQQHKRYPPDDIDKSIVNLLDIAAPSKALRDNHEEYKRLLDRALTCAEAK